MARRRKSQKTSVSLFPFLDILACVIGNLILIITTVVLEQVDTQPVAEAARIEEMREQAKREAARAEKLEKELAELRERSGAATAELEAVRQRIEDAQRRIREAQQVVQQVATPPPVPDEAELKRLEEERKRIEEEIKKLEAEIVERQKPPEQMIAVLPGGAGDGPQRGVFVEAAKEGLVIHEGDTPWKVPAAKIAADPKFKSLLGRVKGDADAIVTFLVRADGLGSLAAGEKAAIAAGVRVGRVPLPGAGALDLSGAKPQDDSKDPKAE
jgi:hypothetical protein